MAYSLILSLGIDWFWNGMFQLHRGFLSLPICFQMYVLLCVYMKKSMEKDMDKSYTLSRRQKVAIILTLPTGICSKDFRQP